MIYITTLILAVSLLQTCFRTVVQPCGPTFIICTIHLRPVHTPMLMMTSFALPVGAALCVRGGDMR